MYILLKKPIIKNVIFSLLFAIIIVGCGSSKTTEPNTGGTSQQTASDTASVGMTVEAENETAPEAGEVPSIFDPNPEYDKYALVDYIVEDIAAEFTATVSAKDDNSEYEIHCNLDGVEQVVVLDKDFNIISDLTGNMSYDAPLVAEKAVKEDKWSNIRD